MLNLHFHILDGNGHTLIMDIKHCMGHFPGNFLGAQVDLANFNVESLILSFNQLITEMNIFVVRNNLKVVLANRLLDLLRSHLDFVVLKWFRLRFIDDIDKLVLDSNNLFLWSHDHSVMDNWLCYMLFDYLECLIHDWSWDFFGTDI